MTIVHETFKGATGQALSGAVVFTPCEMRPASDSSDVIGQCPSVFQTINGVLTTTDLEPGCYRVRVVFDCKNCPEPQTFRIQIDDSPTPLELMDLITAVYPLPDPLTEHVVSLDGESGVITHAELVAMLAGEFPSTVQFTTLAGMVDVIGEKNESFQPADHTVDSLGYVLIPGLALNFVAETLDSEWFLSVFLQMEFSDALADLEFMFELDGFDIFPIPFFPAAAAKLPFTYSVVLNGFPPGPHTIRWKAKVADPAHPVELRGNGGTAYIGMYTVRKN